MTQAIQIWECKKCGHQWANRRKTKRQGVKPHVCPKCKSYLWDESQKEVKDGINPNQ